MAENTKYVARVPIVPDDFANKNQHKNHELVMDFENNDIYIKKDDGYLNITGKIKEDIKKIKDGSAVIHLVTEQTVPPIKERDENHWYWVITDTEDQSGGSLPMNSYVYYGLIKSDHQSKDYLLISQNMTIGIETVPFTISDGYIPCFYVPINYSASFKNHDTGEDIEFTIVDRVYALNNAIGTYISYDVYLLDLTTEGNYNVDLSLEGSDFFTVTLSSNEESIAGLVLPDPIKVRDGYCIGPIPDPTWDDPRFIFKGWSTSKISFNIINPESYKPDDNMTLFAWFEYEADPTLMTYYANYISSGTEGGNIDD